jgi:polyhydroxyalkanoate synthase
MQFLTRQYIDAMAPSNFAATNPEFIKTALATKGEHHPGHQEPDRRPGKGPHLDDRRSAFEVGRNLAVTPGSVIYENELIQLIQYAPLTEKVARAAAADRAALHQQVLHPRPAAGELAGALHAVEQGITVFLVSWKNAAGRPRPSRLGRLSRKGPAQALKVVREVPRSTSQRARLLRRRHHPVVGAAVLRARGEDPVASLTLLTTLLDFADRRDRLPGRRASVAAREATIGKGGLLRAASWRRCSPACAPTT